MFSPAPLAARCTSTRSRTARGRRPSTFGVTLPRRSRQTCVFLLQAVRRLVLRVGGRRPRRRARGILYVDAYRCVFDRPVAHEALTVALFPPPPGGAVTASRRGNRGYRSR